MGANIGVADLVQCRRCVHLASTGRSQFFLIMLLSTIEVCLQTASSGGTGGNLRCVHLCPHYGLYSKDDRLPALPVRASDNKNTIFIHTGLLGMGEQPPGKLNNFAFDPKEVIHEDSQALK